VSLLLQHICTEETLPCGGASKGDSLRQFEGKTHTQDNAGPSRQAFVFYSLCNILALQHPSPPPPALQGRRPGHAGLPVVRTVELHIRFSNAD
jgi:hypothetical protein